MLIPRWGHTPIWVLFGVVVYLPVLWLGWGASGAADGAPLSGLLLTDGQWGLLRNSVLLAAGAAGLATLVGVPYALLCERAEVPGRRVLSLAYLVPLIVPPYMHAIVWGRLLAQNGPVSAFLVEHMNLGAAPLDVHSLGGAILVLGLAYFPFVTLLTVGGLRTLDRDCEAAALLHRGRLATLWRVTLPMVRPQIVAGALFVFVLSLVDFGVPDILRVRVYPVEIFIQFSALYDERAAVLLSLPLLVLAVGAGALMAATMGGRSYLSLGAGTNAAQRWRLGPWRPVGLVLCAVPIVLSVGVPLLALAISAGPWATYAKALKSAGEQIWVSLLLAALAAGLMCVFALFLAAALDGAKGRTRALLQGLTQIPFAIPAVVLGIGMIRLWNVPATAWLYETRAIVVLGYVAHFIPFAVRAVHANMQQLNPRLLEAARLAVASEPWLGLRIALPLLRNGLLTAFFVAFVLSLGELGVTLLVTPPGTATIPITIYNYMHYGAEATVSALCLILVALGLAVAAALMVLDRRVLRFAQ